MDENIGAGAIESPIEGVRVTDVERAWMPADEVQLLQSNGIEALRCLSVPFAFLGPEFS